MNAAIVGAGTAGFLHALSLRAHGIRIGAVFDPDRDKARTLAEVTGANVEPDVAAIARSDARWVSVTSPPRFHVEQARACSRPGRTVLVEKPVALDEQELRVLRGLDGCVPIVQWRAGRAIRAVRRAVIHGEFGEAPSMSMDLSLHRDEEYFRRGRGSRAAWGCGALLSVGIHAVDAACFALDRNVDRVAAVVDDPDSGMERSAGLVVSFSGGALMALRITFDSGPDRTRLSVSGSGVNAIIEGTEADPTAGPIAWSAADPSRLRSFRELEMSTEGAVASPLLVPFIGRVIAARNSGFQPGQHPDVPSIDDVGPAHALVFRAYASVLGDDRPAMAAIARRGARP